MKIRLADVKKHEIPVIHLAIGLTWILAGNFFLQSLTVQLPRELQISYQTYKGVTYVVLTSIVLFLILKNHRKQIISSEEQYRSLFACNPNPMWVYNTETKRIIKVNNAAEKSYGYSNEEFLKLTIYDIRPEEYREKLDFAIAGYKESHQYAGRWIHRKKSGEVFTVSVISHSVRFDDQNCRMVLALDIEELVQNENKLKEAYSVEKQLNHALEANNQILQSAYKENRRFGEILCKVHSMVLLLNNEGRIEWVNRAFTEITGYTNQEARNHFPPELLAGQNSAPHVFDEIICSVREKKPICVETINYTKDKQEYWVQINISPILDERGELDGIISVENIITDRKIKEAKIAAQNTTLREVAWLSSHQLRRPVASILSLSDLLNDNLIEEERREITHLLKTSAKELDNVSREVTRKINMIENTLKPELNEPSNTGELTDPLRIS